jgi:hypothetical protein
MPVETIVGKLIDVLLSFLDKRRRVRFTIHKAYFRGNPTQHYFLNVANLSQRDVEITHVYFQGKPQISVEQQDRPLPKRLKPDEPWETYIRVSNVSKDINRKPFRKGRLRLSTGKTFKSRRNRNVPESGTPPGGPITQRIILGDHSIPPSSDHIQ